MGQLNIKTFNVNRLSDKNRFRTSTIFEVMSIASFYQTHNMALYPSPNQGSMKRSTTFPVILYTTVVWMLIYLRKFIVANLVKTGLHIP
jgi:hypothetical protein